MCIDQSAAEMVQHSRQVRSSRGQHFVSAAGQRGVSLVELVIVIVIISVAVVGIISIMNLVTARSADALLRKQALAIGESMLEEIELQDFTSQGGATTQVTQANRTSAYHVVADYNGFSSSGIYVANGNTPIAGLGNYSLAVTVVPAALNPSGPAAGVAAASSVLVTVTVTDPIGQVISVNGYRTAYN